MSDKKRLEAIYIESSKTGNLPEFGLCNTLKNRGFSTKNLLLFHPTSEDMMILNRKNLASAFWGSGLNVDNAKKYRKFTPLRQTILAFLIAMEEN